MLLYVIYPLRPPSSIDSYRLLLFIFSYRMTAIGPGDSVYTGIGAFLPRGPSYGGPPLAIGEYLGNTSTDIARAFDANQMLPLSLPGVDNLGKALNPQFTRAPQWDVAQGMQIAELGKEIFQLFGTKFVEQAHANMVYAARVYPRGSLVPITEHTTGDAFVSFGYSFNTYMGEFGKQASISISFLKTPDGQKEFLQQLAQLSDAYVITALATIIGNVMQMPRTFAEWSRSTPQIHKTVEPKHLIRESTQLFAARSKKHPSAVSTIIKTRCPDANTAFVANIFIDNDIFGETRRDPDLYPGSMFPVYKGQRSISYIVPIPSLPTGRMNETKALTRSQAAYTTFMTLPPSASVIEFYDYRSRQFVTLSRDELYENVAFDMIDDGKDKQLLRNDPQGVYPHDQRNGGGFVVFRVFHWEGHAVALCDHRKVTLLTTDTQLLQSTSAPQNTLEVHMRCRLGTLCSDAGASTYLLPIPFVTDLSAGGSSKFYSRQLLAANKYRLLDPRLNDRSLIVIRCDAKVAEALAKEMYIPALGTWSGFALQSLGVDMMKNVDWGAAQLDELGHNFELGSFSVGQLFEGDFPRMPEVVFRDAHSHLGVVNNVAVCQKISGCAPHEDMTTAEILGETGLATRSAMNPDVTSKRLRLGV